MLFVFTILMIPLYIASPFLAFYRSYQLFNFKHTLRGHKKVGWDTFYRQYYNPRRDLFRVLLLGINEQWSPEQQAAAARVNRLTTFLTGIEALFILNVLVL